jgi:hypothetical protein
MTFHSRGDTGWRGRRSQMFNVLLRKSSWRIKFLLSRNSRAPKHLLLQKLVLHPELKKKKETKKCHVLCHKKGKNGEWFHRKQPCTLFLEVYFIYLCVYIFAFTGLPDTIQCARLLEFCDMHMAREDLKGEKSEDNEPISGVFTFCQSEHWKVFITIIYITEEEKILWNLLLV